MAKIIASVFARSREQVLRLASRAAMAGADWLELRLDHWPAGHDLAPVIAAVRLPVLVACRTPEDGGHFLGTLGERRELLAHALQAGAEGIDLEQWETWTPPKGLTGLQLSMRSFHSFTGVPKELAAIRDQLTQNPGTVAKIVVTAHDLADAAPVLELLAATNQRRQPVVAFAMGRTAWPTRVLAAAMGAPFVYGTVDEHEATAPGQPPVHLLSQLFRVHELSAATQWFGLLGNPASTSLGPWLHNRAFRRLSHDGVYLPFETSRPEAVFAMLPRPRLRGLSVTAPHKERMLEVCDEVGPAARALAATNTLVLDPAGRCVGHNTDVLGVASALREALDGGASAGEPAAVLGAGGAARAAAWALRELGFDVTLLARSLEPARAFAREHGFRLGSLATNVLDEIAPKVVVQATPVGSTGHGGEPRLLPDWVPAPGTIVHDLVYRPHRTRLLADAEAAGARAVPGLEMFLHQAAAQLRLFVGRSLETAQLRSFLAGALGMLIVCCGLFGPLAAQSGVATVDRRAAAAAVEVDGAKYPYRVLRTAPDDDVRPLPVVLFLHGAGERGSDNRAQLRWLAERFAAPEAQRRWPCQLVLPQCPAGEQWVAGDWRRPDAARQDAAPTRALRAAMLALDAVVAGPGVDPARVLVTGLSMGGFGTIDAATRWPERFAAALPICGGGDPATAARLAAMPVWLWHGADDPVVPVAWSRRFAAALREVEAPVRYDELPGVKHNAWSDAYGGGEALDWLLGHDLRTQRRGPFAIPAVVPALDVFEPGDGVFRLGERASVHAEPAQHDVAALLATMLGRPGMPAAAGSTPQPGDVVLRIVPDLEVAIEVVAGDVLTLAARDRGALLAGAAVVDQALSTLPGHAMPTGRLVRRRIPAPLALRLTTVDATAAGTATDELWRACRWFGVDRVECTNAVWLRDAAAASPALADGIRLGPLEPGEHTIEVGLDAGSALTFATRLRYALGVAAERQHEGSTDTPGFRARIERLLR
jgi:3-dehydroquinate dehydratase / shikimate dehydrogenase